METVLCDWLGVVGIFFVCGIPRIEAQVVNILHKLKKKRLEKNEWCGAS